MDFENAKENIQPLASGRNASVLAVSLSSHNELFKEREHLETAITTYNGDDPLEPWYEYILWIEQSYPSGGNESGLKKVLLKCLVTFEDDKRYYQDRRMIRIYIKYIDSEENPQDLYQELYNSGIGTMVADLYICWAYYHDLAGNFQKADNIFRKGLEVRAQPYDDLDQAHKHFGFTMSQRILYQDESSKEEFLSSLRDRRHALTSLRAHKKKVGSIRTGSAIKSNNPGRIKINEQGAMSSTCNNNIQIQVFEDENKNPNVLEIPDRQEDELHIPIVRNIIDSARKQENLREPGLWSKGSKHKGNLFDKTDINHEPAFTILEDVNETEPSKCLTPLPDVSYGYSQGIQLPEQFATKNYPQSLWKVETVMDNEIRPRAFPLYNKLFCYPKPNIEYSPGEVRAYKWFIKHSKQNKFTNECEIYFGNNYEVGTRLYPNFAKKNIPKKDSFKLSEFKIDLKPNVKFTFNLDNIYSGFRENNNITEEKQFEEILYDKWKKGERKLKFDGDETILMVEEMDETQCFVNVVGRKSIFPSRKSMAPFPMDGMAAFKPIPAPIQELNNIENTPHKSPEKVLEQIKPPDSRRKSVIMENPIQTQHTSDITNKSLNISKNESSKQFLFPTRPVETEILNKSKKIVSPIQPFNSVNQELDKNSPVYEDINHKIEEPKLPDPKSINDNFEVYEDIHEKFEEQKKPNQKTFPIYIDNDEKFEEQKEPNQKTFPVYVDNDEKFAEPKLQNQKNVEENFLVYKDADEKLYEPNQPDQENLIDNFEIFEDPIGAFEFKAPKPRRSVLRPKMSHAIFEDDTELQNNATGIFAPNETCSTQTFNLYLKAQSVSTPISSKHPISHFKLVENSHPVVKNFTFDEKETPALQTSPNLETNSILKSPTVFSPESQEQTPGTTIPYKQLSTIMETSETNAMHTGSTKSSVDTHLSQGQDLENEISKFPTIKTTSHMLVIPEGNSFNEKSKSSSKTLLSDKFLEGTESIFKENEKINISVDRNLINLPSKECKMQSRIELQPPRTVLITSPLEEVENTVPINLKSIQQFEEKTETVPKMLLTRQNVKSQPDDDLYSFFAKTPERKPQSTNKLTAFEINDSMTFSKLKELTLQNNNEPKKITSNNSPIHKLPQISTPPNHEDDLYNFFKDSYVNNKSTKKDTEKYSVDKILKINSNESMKLPTFEDTLPTIPKLNDLTLTKLNPLNTLNESKKMSALEINKMNPSLDVSKLGMDKSKINSSIKISKLGFLQKSLLNDNQFEEQSSKLISPVPVDVNKLIEPTLELQISGSKKKEEKLLDFSNSQTSLKSSLENRPQFERLSFFNQSKQIEKSLMDNINHHQLSLEKSYKNSAESSKINNFFEDNIQTDAFAPNLSAIKNSTWLPNFQIINRLSNIKEQSIHIKEEFPEFNVSNKIDNIERKSPNLKIYTATKSESLLANSLKIFNKSKKADVEDINQATHFTEPTSSQVAKSESLLATSLKIFNKSKKADLADINQASHFTEPTSSPENSDDDIDRNIYQHTFKTPNYGKHTWSDDDNDADVVIADDFIHIINDLDQTNIFINEKICDNDPFSLELKKAFLDRIEFSTYIEKLDICELKGKVAMLKKGKEVQIKNNNFNILKIIGEGTFGTIYSGKENTSGKVYALKQEKPANLWEFYICLEIRARLETQGLQHFLPAFMDIKQALIANNSSILVTNFSPYGSFISICNTFKRKTSKNLDEYVVMTLTSQILSIIDHLHALQIVHADIKPDNFLLMTKLNYDSKEIAIQLIDFGVSIDMQLFPKGQEFNYCHKADDFKCIEMLENRPWTYQTDLFGVVGTIHVLLFGKYMDVYKTISGNWEQKQKFPRYLNKSIWQTIFNSLLNIRDCNKMPNLQNLRTILEEVLVEKAKYVKDKLTEFNMIIEQ